MKALRTLIDKASEMCGSDAALARKLAISHPLITMIRKEERSMTPELAARLADMVGSDAMTAMAQAVVEGEKDPQKREVLKEILGKALRGGGVAMSLISYSVALSLCLPTKQAQAEATTITEQLKLEASTIYTLYLRLVHMLRHTAGLITDRLTTSTSTGPLVPLRVAP